MHYEIVQPHPRLAPYVEHLWLLVAAAAPVHAPPAPELVLPDGRTELILHFGDRFERRAGSGLFEPQARALFAGQLTGATELRATGAVGMIAARFKPAGAARLFAFPLDAVTNDVADLEALLGAAARELTERIGEAATHAQRFAVLQSFLLARLADREDDVLVREACRFIALEGEALSSLRLAERIGLGERQLERRFKDKVGVAPKVFMRILRLQRVLKIFREQPMLPLTECALACGYYDQSHFIRDFKALTGLSPSAYRAQVHALNDNFSDSLG